MSQNQNQTQGIAPMTFFPPFPPFPIVPLYIPQLGSDNDIINVGSGSITIGGNPSPVTVTQVTTAEYTATAQDYFLCVDTTTEPVTITLPTGILGTVYIVKDCSGDADTNNITVQGTAQDVDGGTAIINSPYGSLSFIFNGSEWSIV